MTQDTPVLKSWQFFAACRKVLGQATMYKIFRVNDRESLRWAADPNFCADVRNNPLDQIHAAMRSLALIGHETIAEAAPAMLARTIGCRLQTLEPSPDDRPLPQRYADAMAACADYIQAVAAGVRYEELHPLLEEAVTSLESLYMECRTGALAGAVCGDVRFCARNAVQKTHRRFWPWRGKEGNVK